MAEIILSGGEKAIVDDFNYERFSKFKWQAFRTNNCIYARRSIRENGKTKSFSLHQEVLGKKGIDHIDGNGLNNMVSNLRECSMMENMRNRRKHVFKTSQYKGVFWKKTHNKFQASIRVKGTLIPLGFFTCEKEAAETYNLAAPLFFGEFANLNTI